MVLELVFRHIHKPMFLTAETNIEEFNLIPLMWKCSQIDHKVEMYLFYKHNKIISKLNVFNRKLALLYNTVHQSREIALEKVTQSFHRKMK